MGSDSATFVRKDGWLARHAGNAGVAIRSRGSPMRTAGPRSAVETVRCSTKSTDAMRQQRNTTGGARRMFARTSINWSRYGQLSENETQIFRTVIRTNAPIFNSFTRIVLHWAR
jgi:hypothetical protein